MRNVMKKIFFSFANVATREFYMAPVASHPMSTGQLWSGHWAASPQGVTLGLAPASPQEANRRGVLRMPGVPHSPSLKDGGHPSC